LRVAAEMTHGAGGRSIGTAARDWTADLQKLDEYRWLLPQEYKAGMRVTAEEMEEARRREERFRAGKPPASFEDRIVIIVDDGLATGATMRAAVRSVKQSQPLQVIVAVPVGSREACAALRQEADEVVCPYEPEAFWAIGYFYANFEPTEDAEVQRLLESAHREELARQTAR
jgi:predicted phosphoribosyltransferase